MATASRPNSGSLSTQFVHAVEKVRPDVIDVARKEILFLQLAKDMGFYKMSDSSFAEINPIIESKDVPVTTISTGFETLPTTAVKGAQATYVEYANYTAPVSMSLIEELKIKSPYQLIDLAKTRTYKAAVSIGERLERDAFQGTSNGSMNIFGLEQAIYAKAALSQSSTTPSGVLAYPRWKFRQANNTYQGITRTAFTADDVGGTHWENNSLSFKSADWASSPPTTFSVASGAPSDALKLMNRFYGVNTYGTDAPNLIISDYKPMEDYQNACVGLIQYVKSGSDTQKANLGFGGCYFKGAWWVATEQCTASGLSGGDAAAGNSMIYFLNTKWMRMECCRGADFVSTEWARNAGQLAAATQILWRGQLLLDNPRTCGVIYGYGG